MKKEGCYSYKHLPQEAINYALDHLSDQFSKGFRQSNDWTICFTGNILKVKFEEALMDKVHDMLWEVRHNQRDDYRRGQLDNLDIKGVKK